MIDLFLADGFEEIEALAVVDILRRAELPVTTVGVGAIQISGAHHIPVAADILDVAANQSNLTGVILPGGGQGTIRLEKSPVVQSFIDRAAREGKTIGAICAAPSILGHKGLLRGKKAVCYPGFEKELEGADIVDAPVAEDGNIITSKGAGTAILFALALVKRFAGAAAADRVRAAIQWPL